MNQLIYVETSIPSFYFETRLGVAENQARKNWTRRWWDKANAEDTLVTSLAVINELLAAPDPKRSDALGLIDQLTLLQDDPEVDNLVDAYIANKVMPSDASGDARHLALATWHKCDILVSWNCRHIANANKADHIHRINGRLGFETPKLITPLALLNEPT
jgi:hypothetical protein